MDLTGLKSRSWKDCVPLWRLYGRTFPCFLLLSEATHVLLLVVPILHFQEAHAVSSLCAFLLWSHLSHFAFPFLLLRGLVITFHKFN